MHNIGEKIIYGVGGVHEIVDIRDEMVLGEKRRYYVLRPKGDRADSLVFVPTDNEKLVLSMRPLLTRKEIMELIEGAPDIPLAKWQKDSRLRSQEFKKIIDSGDRKALISIIKSIYKNDEARREEGKRGYLSDEHVMQRAEKLLYSEFSEVLGIAEDGVVEFIVGVCDNKQ